MFLNSTSVQHYSAWSPHSTSLPSSPAVYSTLLSSNGKSPPAASARATNSVPEWATDDRHRHAQCMHQLCGKFGLGLISIWIIFQHFLPISALLLYDKVDVGGLLAGLAGEILLLIWFIPSMIPKNLLYLLDITLLSACSSSLSGMGMGGREADSGRSTVKFAKKWGFWTKFLVSQIIFQIQIIQISKTYESICAWLSRRLSL